MVSAVLLEVMTFLSAVCGMHQAARRPRASRWGRPAVLGPSRGGLRIKARGSIRAQPVEDLLVGGGPAWLPQSDSSCRAGGACWLAPYSRFVAPAAAAASCSASSRSFLAVVGSSTCGRSGGADVTGLLWHWRQPRPSWAAGGRAPPPSRQLAAGIGMPPPRLCAAASTPRSAFRERVQQAVLSSAPSTSRIGVAGGRSKPRSQRGLRSGCCRSTTSPAGMRSSGPARPLPGLGGAQSSASRRLRPREAPPEASRCCYGTTSTSLASSMATLPTATGPRVSSRGAAG